MQVATFTRRQVVDMFPELLSKRALGYRPRGEAFAAEQGASWTALVILAGSFIDKDGEIVTRTWYKRRSPYAIKDARPATWAELVSAGLAEAVADGWKLTTKGAAAASEHQRRLYAHLEQLELPADGLERVARQLDRLAHRVPPSAERAARARRWWDLHPAVRTTVRSVSDAAQVLWAFRDDCHIGAWRAAGYEGPPFDVLSYCWSSPADVSWTKIGGLRTVDALAKALEAKQDRSDVERNVGELVGRGDLARLGGEIHLTPQGQRSRDAIEAETDRRYFEIWDLDDAATAQLGEDLRAVIDALPRPAA